MSSFKTSTLVLHAISSSDIEIRANNKSKSSNTELKPNTEKTELNKDSTTIEFAQDIIKQYGIKSSCLEEFGTEFEKVIRLPIVSNVLVPLLDQADINSEYIILTLFCTKSNINIAKLLSHYVSKNLKGIDTDIYQIDEFELNKGVEEGEKGILKTIKKVKEKLKSKLENNLSILALISDEKNQNFVYNRFLQNVSTFPFSVHFEKFNSVIKPRKYNFCNGFSDGQKSIYNFKNSNLLDEHSQRVIEELKTFKNEFLENEECSEIKEFWLRKTKQAVLCVVLVTLPGGQSLTFRGLNLEVSMPTGSLCAERNAIGTALSQYSFIKRKHFEMIALVAISLDEKRPEGNPINPCGVCRNWISKIARENLFFKILSFKDSNCEEVLETLLPIKKE